MSFHRRITRAERVASFLLAVCFVLVGIDSGRVPYTEPQTWTILYAPAVLSAAWYALSARLTALQLMVVFIALPGLFRAVLYLIGPEHRLTPVGLNGAIALLLFMYHHARRLDAL